MSRARTPLILAVVVVTVAGLAGCSSGSGDDASAPSSSSSEASSTDTGSDVTAVDVCALVPADLLATVMGADPGEGTSAVGQIDGGQCTWAISDTHTAIAQYSRQADVYFPEDVYPKPDGASDVDGVDRGWSSAETHTIVLVKDGAGLMFNDIDFGDGDQDAFDALAAGIAAKL